LKEKKYLLSFIVIFLSPLLAVASSQPFFSGATTSVDDRRNVAAAEHGGTATASSTADNYTPDAVINGDRKGVNLTSGGAWRDETPAVFPDWIEVEFNGAMSIDEINVFTQQDSWWAPIEPTETTTFFNNGITNFEVQYWHGTSWVTVPNGIVTNNTKVWRKFTFAPLETSKIRVLVNAARSTASTVVELEAFGVAAEAPTPSPTPTPAPPPTGDVEAALAARGIFFDADNNVGFGTQNPIFNDDGTTGGFVGNWVAVDGKLTGASAYFGVGGNIPGPNERVGALNFYNIAMGGADHRTAAIFSFNGPTLGTGNMEFYTAPNFIGPVRRMQISPTGEIGINHSANVGTMVQMMGKTSDASQNALGVLNSNDRPLLTVRNDGQVAVGQPGQGIVLKSPNGLVCRKLTIDNNGNLVVANMASCP
jgi:F5/8 type C domain-containing protein